LHVRIGRRFLETFPQRELEEHLFDVVNQVNLGAARVSDEDERMRFAQLNARAAFKAKGASAYGAAIDYLKHAIHLLPQDAWNSFHDFAFLLHREAIECAYVTSPALADEYFESARQHAQTPLEKAGLCAIRVAVCTTNDALAEAIRWGREGLALL